MMQTIFLLFHITSFFLYFHKQNVSVVYETWETVQLPAAVTVTNCAVLLCGPLLAAQPSSPTLRPFLCRVRSALWWLLKDCEHQARSHLSSTLSNPFNDECSFSLMMLTLACLYLWGRGRRRWSGGICWGCGAVPLSARAWRSNLWPSHRRRSSSHTAGSTCVVVEEWKNQLKANRTTVCRYSEVETFSLPCMEPQPSITLHCTPSQLPIKQLCWFSGFIFWFVD